MNHLHHLFGEIIHLKYILQHYPTATPSSAESGVQCSEVLVQVILENGFRCKTRNRICIPMENLENSCKSKTVKKKLFLSCKSFAGCNLCRLWWCLHGYRQLSETNTQILWWDGGGGDGGGGGGDGRCCPDCTCGCGSTSNAHVEQSRTSWGL